MGKTTAADRFAQYVLESSGGADALPEYDGGWALYRLVTGSRKFRRVSAKSTSASRRYVDSVTGAEIAGESAKYAPTKRSLQAIADHVRKSAALDAYDAAASRLCGLIVEGEVVNRDALAVALDSALESLH